MELRARQLFCLSINIVKQQLPCYIFRIVVLFEDIADMFHFVLHTHLMKLRHFLNVIDLYTPSRHLLVVT